MSITTWRQNSQYQGISGTVMVWQEPREGRGIDKGAGAGGRGLSTVAFGNVLGGCRV